MACWAGWPVLAKRPASTAPTANRAIVSAKPMNKLAAALDNNPKISIFFRPNRSVNAPPIVLPKTLVIEKIAKIIPTVVMPTPNLAVT